MVEKSIHEINRRIKDGSVNVVTAEEMVGIVAEFGAEGAAKEVDVVTTGTFGAMCSSGVWVNLGHSEPPIKMQNVWFNDVEAYTGLAAVDAYIGATQLHKPGSDDEPKKRVSEIQCCYQQFKPYTPHIHGCVITGFRQRNIFRSRRTLTNIQ
jgi:uncharacterized protein (DUF39 family)